MDINILIKKLQVTLTKTDHHGKFLGFDPWFYFYVFKIANL